MTAPPPRLDAAGVALSALCLLHCLAVPLVATGAFAWAASEHVHLALIATLAVVVGAVALPGFRRHRQPAVPLLLAGGLALLVAAAASGEALGETGETLLTTAGSVALVAGHVLNLRLRTLARRPLPSDLA